MKWNEINWLTMLLAIILILGCIRLGLDIAEVLMSWSLTPIRV